MRTPVADSLAVDAFRHVFANPNGPCTRCGVEGVQIVTDHISICPAKHVWTPAGHLECAMGLVLICTGPPRLS